MDAHCHLMQVGWPGIASCHTSITIERCSYFIDFVRHPSLRGEFYFLLDGIERFSQTKPETRNFPF